MASVRIENLPPYVVHDPELAHAIHRVLVEEVGARSKQYRKFLEMVRMFAGMLGIVFVNPYDGKKKNTLITVKAPTRLVARVDEIARELGVTRSEVVRLALTITVLAWDAARAEAGGPQADPAQAGDDEGARPRG